MAEDPIQNLDEFDIVGERKDGGVDLVIVVSSFLDYTPTMEHLVKRKIQNYVDAINSEKFQSEYGGLEDTKYRIILSCTVLPHERMLVLLEAIKEHLAEYDIDLHVVDFGGHLK